MKKYLTALFIGIASTGIAQNYQTFTSTDIHYFKEDNVGLMLASQIDSVHYVEGDSILFPFTSFREGGPEDFVEAPSWMGAKIIIKNDGKNLFFNRDLDTITIDTWADVGESFTLYTYESGNTIEATVVSIASEMVLDELDSVKTYVLSSDEPSFDIESTEFRIGKNSGMLTYHPFYSFPYRYDPIVGPSSISETFTLVGQLYPRKGLTKPTRKDENNLNVGDVIQYKDYYAGGINTYTRRVTVLTKTYVDDTTVTFDLEEYELHEFTSVTPELPSFDSVTISYTTTTLSISEEFLTEQLIPEKDYKNHLTEGDTPFMDFTFALTHNVTCGYKEKFRSWGSTRDSLTDTTGTIFEPQMITFTYLSGGLLSYHTYYHNTGTDILDYGHVFLSGKYDARICGEGHFLSTDAEQMRTFNVYPNPSNGIINIDLEGPFDIAIYTSAGQMVYTENNLVASNPIETNLPSGIYLISVTQNESVYHKKMIIQ